jgi:hypothetical protein
MEGDTIFATRMPAQPAMVNPIVFYSLAVAAGREAAVINPKNWDHPEIASPDSWIHTDFV